MSVDETDPWSVTEQDLFASMRSYRDIGTRATVATIVDVEGSAYRRPGATMLVVPDAESFGAITAGCLEGPVEDLAEDVLASGTPIVHTFDLMDEEGWGLGLGCNGIIDIFLEPLDDGWDPVLDELDEGHSVAVATVVATDDDRLAIGDRTVTDASGDRIDVDRTDTASSDADPGTFPDSVADAVADERDRLRETGGAATVSVATARGSVDVFVEWLTPPPELLLFGNQNDVHPVARIGHEAGFRTVVASSRGARSDPEQFPNAHAVRTTKPTDLGHVVENADRTYAVLMSHNAIDDRLALVSLLETDVPYIGLMGPRDRFEDIRETLSETEDRHLTDDELARIATPVGLDLGSGEPIGIAISIVAEALSVHNGRDGERLSDREGPIHGRRTLAE